MKYWKGEYHTLNFAHQALTMSEDVLLIPSNLLFACIMLGHCLIPLVAVSHLLV